MINARAAARTAAGMALLGLLATGATKCQTSGGGGGGGDSAGGQGDCTFDEVRPPSTFAAPGSGLWITSAVIVSCDPQPRSHRLVMQMQKYSSGAWVTIWIEHPDTTVPGPGGHRSVIVYNGCDPGRWRLKVRITGSAKGGTPYQVDRVTTTSRITC